MGKMRSKCTSMVRSCFHKPVLSTSTACAELFNVLSTNGVQALCGSANAIASTLDMLGMNCTEV